MENNENCIVTNDGTTAFWGRRTLEMIADELKRCQSNTDEAYLKAGQLLLEAKSQFGGYGGWLDWLRDNVDFSISKAQRLMRTARWLDEKKLRSFF